MRSIKLPSWIEGLLGLAPVGVPPHVFALERDRLSYARFHPDARGLELREHLAVELDPGLFPDGPLAGAPRDRERLVEAVGALLDATGTTVREASLVLPDEWLRVAFADATDVPPRGAQRDEVIRFKLRRLAPFRVEELRVSAAAAPGLETADGEPRMILGFASEDLLAEVEDVFAARGVRLGQVSNQSLALLSALETALGSTEAAVVVHATTRSYCLMVTRRGRSVLHRHKMEAGGDVGAPDLVRRDLRLTERFVTQRMGARLDEVVFVGPAAAEAAWERALGEAFEAPVRSLAREWGEVPGTVAGVTIDEAAVLLGAASRRIA